MLDMYEQSGQRPLSRYAFLRRIALHFIAACLLILVSLGIGVTGFILLEGLPLEDAFLHSAVLLSGLGLAKAPVDSHAKIFVGLYALYSGLIFLATFGIVLAPIAHRILHTFHWDSGRHNPD